jgi:hypothetical protein
LISSYQQEKVVVRDNGKYIISKMRRVDRLSPPIIYGKIYEYGADTLLEWSRIRELPSMTYHKTDHKTKTYSAILIPGKHKFRGLSVPPWKGVQTKSLKLSIGDSIRIDFYLKRDTIPLH